MRERRGRNHGGHAYTDAIELEHFTRPASQVNSHDFPARGSAGYSESPLQLFRVGAEIRPCTFPVLLSTLLLMSAQLEPRYTIEEYLEYERKAEERHIFFDGILYAMAGESEEHGIISMNIAAEVGLQLRGTPCQGRTKDARVRSGPAVSSSRKGLFSYPDIVIVCGTVEYHDDKRDVITNPMAIVEVLSDSTAEFDRGEKFMRYRMWNPTLTDYMLISQSSPVVERLTKREDGTWISTLHEGLDSIVVVESINLRLPLALVYDRVQFVE